MAGQAGGGGRRWAEVDEAKRGEPGEREREKERKRERGGATGSPGERKERRMEGRRDRREEDSAVVAG